MSWYQKALDVDPSYRKSREALEGLLAFQIDERDPEAQRLYKLGLQQLVSGKIEGAAGNFKTSLEIESYPATWLALGTAYRRLGKNVEARQAFAALSIAGRGTAFEGTAEQALREMRETLPTVEK